MLIFVGVFLHNTLGYILGYVTGVVARFTKPKRRTISIEVGMQNAAQAISIASSPLIFANDTMAIPAILYSLVMNIVLLSYVGLVRKARNSQ